MTVSCLRRGKREINILKNDCAFCKWDKMRGQIDVNDQENMSKSFYKLSSFNSTSLLGSLLVSITKKCIGH